MGGEEGEWEGRRENGRGGGRMGEEVGEWERRRKGGVHSSPFFSYSLYLLVRFEGPVILNSGVTEVLHFPQHGCHECGPQLFCISAHSLPLFVYEVLSCPRVELEGRQGVQEATATVHVPVWAGT